MDVAARVTLDDLLVMARNRTYERNPQSLREAAELLNEAASWIKREKEYQAIRAAQIARRESNTAFDNPDAITAFTERAGVRGPDAPLTAIQAAEEQRSELRAATALATCSIPSSVLARAVQSIVRSTLRNADPPPTG